VITAYAVAAGLRRPCGVTGIGGTPLELVSHRRLVAAVTRHRVAPDPSREAILAHAAVCEDLMGVADAVLPVRFGAVFDGVTALRTSLDDRYDDLVGGLDHVQGRVEIGVRIRWDGADTMAREGSPAETPVHGGSGRAYVMTLVAQEQRRRAAAERAEAVAGDIHRAIAIPAKDSRLEVLPTSGLLMSGAYLVERDDVDRMVAGVRTSAQDHPELDVLCTGPWPPYNFADPEVSRA
jgi:Gas vesicle synthesis protein GvpL/GvpF